MSNYSDVFILDDEQNLCELYADFLTKGVVKATGFTSPQAALSAIESGAAPAVIVTDLRMPEMNGLDFVERARKRTNASFVMMSGLADRQHLARAMSLGITGFLEKPFGVEQLQETVLAEVYRVMISQVESIIAAEAIEALEPNSQLIAESMQRYTDAENILFDKGIPWRSTPDGIRSLQKSLVTQARLRDTVDKYRSKIENLWRFRRELEKAIPVEASFRRVS